MLSFPMLAPLLALAVMQEQPFTKGSELSQQCKNWAALVDKTRTLTEDELYAAGECEGFVNGLMSGLISMRVGCPGNATLGTLIRVYLVYVDKHPKVLDMAASAGLFGAVKEAYPCPVK